MHDTSDTNNNSNVSCPENQIKNRTINKNDDKSIKATENDANNYVAKIRWPDLCAQLFLHVGAIYGLIFQFYAIKFYTLLWCKYELKMF